MGKEFDRWLLEKLGKDEWIVKAIQTIYEVAVNKTKVSNEFSNELSIQINIF